MGSEELLRGMTADDLTAAGKWYFNEYRGGRNADAYPHWDWACDYMSTLDFWGAWQEQNEGTTLQIRNNDEHRANPADLSVFDSYDDKTAHPRRGSFGASTFWRPGS
jgi:hypothetical protein